MATNELHADEPDYVLPQNFYDGTLTYSHYDRLGGLFSFLKKTFRTDLVERLGENAATTMQVPIDTTNRHSNANQSDMSICRVFANNLLKSVLIFFVYVMYRFSDAADHWWKCEQQYIGISFS